MLSTEYVGNQLGEFEEAGEHRGRPYFLQRNTEGSQPNYLYFEDGCWQVSQTLGNRFHGIRNCQDTQLPPTRSWHWREGERNDWRSDDTSLSLEFTTLSPICQVVRVAGEGEVVALHGSGGTKSLGDYRLEYILLEV